MSAVTRSSFPSYHLYAHGKSRAPAVSTDPFRLPCLGKPKRGGFSFSVINNGLYLFNNNRRNTIKMDLNAVENLNSGAPPLPSGSGPFPGWLNWMLLSVLPVLLPFIKNKWGPLMAIKKQVDTAIETVECATEIVEDVAKQVDKIADEVAENLPDGSVLKNAICAVDDIAENVIKGADFAQDIIEKVEEAEKNMESEIEKSAKEQENVAPIEEKQKN